MSRSTILYFLMGPTASGKESVALHLAPEIGAEIISLDSMKLYRGMDIGTAKSSQEAQEKVAHHLIDIINPNDHFSTGEYVKQAEDVIAQIVERQVKPLFVGGTALYAKRLLEGIFRGPRADWEIRERLKKEIEKDGLDKLYTRLETVDPEAASTVHPNDERRIIRALEVFEKTGQPISVLRREQTHRSKYNAVKWCIERDREDLYRRIDTRVETMFEKGLVEEVRRLREPPGLGTAASQALGYKEINAYLEGGFDLDEAKDLIKRHTRQFAKRQLTWFRNFSDIHWVPVAPEEAPKDIAKRILSEFF